MSYCRWGYDNSDVYLYGSESGGWVCCCGERTQLDTVSDVIKHMKRHIKKGDVVPKYVFARLRAEQKEELCW